MDIQKPQPLMMGGKAYYTLSSTDPVEIEVVVPQVTEEELDLALGDIATQTGVDLAQGADPAWLRANFGTESIDDVREGLRAQMTDANYGLLEQQRSMACAAALAERLQQSVPDRFIEEARRQLETSFAAQMRAEGVDLDQALAHMGLSRLSLTARFDEQAKTMAEQDAALDAFARERKLNVAEEEYPRLMRMTATQAQAMVEQARAVGREAQVRESALHNRALEIVVAECVCTYRHETDEEAAVRVAHLRQVRGRDAAPSPRPARPTNPHLKLV